jgi:hypothetical protein
VFFGHVLPGIGAHGLRRSLSDKEQTKRKGLSKCSGEELIEVASSVSTCLWMSIENVSKFLPYLQERVTPNLPLVKLRQPIANNSSDQTGRVRHQSCQVRGVSGCRLLSRARYQLFNQPDKGGSTVLGDDAIRSSIILVWTECPVGHDDRAADFLATPKNAKFIEVARCPTRQLLESLELIFVLSPPSRWISGLIWRL